MDMFGIFRRAARRGWGEKQNFMPSKPLQESSLWAIGYWLKNAGHQHGLEHGNAEAEEAIEKMLEELRRRDEEWCALALWKEERDRYWEFYWGALRELRAAHAWRGDLVWMRREDMFDA
jgi:hypothetical protein